MLNKNNHEKFKIKKETKLRKEKRAKRKNKNPAQIKEEKTSNESYTKSRTKKEEYEIGNQRERAGQRRNIEKTKIKNRVQEKGKWIEIKKTNKEGDGRIHKKVNGNEHNNRGGWRTLIAYVDRQSERKKTQNKSDEQNIVFTDATKKTKIRKRQTKTNNWLNGKVEERQSDAIYTKTVKKKKPNNKKKPNDQQHNKNQ